MSLGKGLEALIPKKGVVSQSFSSVEKISEPQSSGSLPHKGLGGSPTFSPQKGLERSGVRPKPTVFESIFHIEVEKIKSNPYQPR